MKVQDAGHGEVDAAVRAGNHRKDEIVRSHATELFHVVLRLCTSRNRTRTTATTYQETQGASPGGRTLPLHHDDDSRLGESDILQVLEHQIDTSPVRVVANAALHA